MPAENFRHYSDNGGLHHLFGFLNASSITGAGGSNIQTTQWHSTIRRHARQNAVTGAGGAGMQVFDGELVRMQPYALFNPSGPGQQVIRLRTEIGMEYVSGLLVSRINWGLMANFNASNLIVDTLGLLGEPGHIGFQWRQVGATPKNIVALCTTLNNATNGTNIFSQDTGVVGAAGGTGPTLHSLQIDMDPLVGEIRFSINDALVATYTVGVNDFAVATASNNLRLGAGIYAENPGQCTLYDRIGGQGGIISALIPGV